MRPSGRLSRSAVLSVLLHLLVLAALVVGIERRHEEAFVPPAPIAVVFEHGGAARTTAPRTTRHGPPATAKPAALPAPTAPPERNARPAPTALPPPAPAPPPLPAPAAPRATTPGLAIRVPSFPEVQAFLQPPPVPRPAPLPLAPPAPAGRPPPAPAARPTPAPAPPRTLYMPTFSYGAAPHAPPAAPSRGLNLALSQSQLQRAFAPDFAIEGHIGPDWQAELTRWVDERKYYPYSAIEMNQQGSVEIRLVIDKSGKVEGVSLLQSSGSPFLDSAWLGMFRGASVPPFPPGTEADRITIRATMHYILIE